MATKIYQKGNVLVGTNTVTGETVRINGTFSFYSLDTINSVITIGELTNEHKTMSAYTADVQNELGVPIGSIDLVDDYLSTITNFKPASGGSGVQSVTGNGVDNTDPLNPTMTYPTIQQIGGNYGLYAQTVASATINTIGEQTLIGSGVGSLSIPANGFSVGDSFHGKLGGLLNATGGGSRTEIILNIKAGATILATTGVFDLDVATDEGWELELDFTIASIGAVGQICTNGNFVYTKDGRREVFGYIFQDVQAIDTTVSNTLDITLNFNQINVGDDIYSANFVLYKVF